MTEQKSNELLREAVSAWYGKDRVRQNIIGNARCNEDTMVDVEAIDHAMEFIKDWLVFIDSGVMNK